MTAFAPLAGVVVLERSVTPAAAYAGSLFAQLGADVVVDPAQRDGVDLTERHAAWFAAGKRTGAVTDPAIVLDDSRCAGREPGPMRGTRFTVLLSHAPSGDGAPDRYTSAHGATAEAGLAVAIGRPEREPLGLPPGVAESTAGLHAVAAVLGRWASTPVDGGVEIRLSTADALGYYVGINATMFDGYPREWLREGRRASGSAGPYPAAIFECKDGALGVIGRSVQDYHGLLAAMGDPAWSHADPELRDPFAVARSHADRVDRHVQAWIADLTEAEVTDLSLKHGFVVAPVRTLAEVRTEPQYTGRGFWLEDRPGLPFTVPERTEGTGRGWRGSMDPERPLSGLRVLDLSWVWAGPMVTMIMADLGAEVLKIEHPGRPDGSRLRGRPTRDGAPVDGPDLEVTPYFHQLNHGKLSVGVDLAAPAAADVLIDLARHCDVVVENMRPGVLARRGVGYPQLRAVNPDLVMLSLSLAGQTGPLSALKGYAPVIGGLAGLEGLVGYRPDDVTGLYTHSFADATAGVYGFAAIMAALADRAAGRGGCLLDMSQVETAITLLGLPLADGATGVSGNEDVRYAGQAVVGHSDGTWTAVTARRTDGGVGGQAEWSDLARELSQPQFVRAMREAGMSAEPVHTLASRRAARTDGRIAVGVSIDHPFGPGETIVVPPWSADGHLAASVTRAPLLGEHTVEVLRGLLGYDDARLAAALDAGTVYAPDRGSGR